MEPLDVAGGTEAQGVVNKPPPPQLIRATNESLWPPPLDEATIPRMAATFQRDEKKVGRNDLCPCGSMKKYKACHGRIV